MINQTLWQRATTRAVLCSRTSLQKQWLRQGSAQLKINKAAIELYPQQYMQSKANRRVTMTTINSQVQKPRSSNSRRVKIVHRLKKGAWFFQKVQKRSTVRFKVTRLGIRFLIIYILLSKQVEQQIRSRKLTKSKLKASKMGTKQDQNKLLLIKVRITHF